VVYVLEKLGGRKYIYTIIVSLMGFTLVMTGKIDPNSFFRFLEVVGGSYIIGNVVSKFAE
jgi:hypothetical protein